MDAIVTKLDTKLHEWKPDIATQVRQRISEIIDLADQDTLDVMRSRAVEQEVLDILEWAWLGLNWAFNLYSFKTLFKIKDCPYASFPAGIQIIPQLLSVFIMAFHRNCLFYQKCIKTSFYDRRNIKHGRYTAFLLSIERTKMPNKSLENRRENAIAFPASQLQRYAAIED